MAKQDLIQRYEEAYKRYENRIKSWTKKFHAIVKQIPKVKYTKNISEKSIERLEKQKWTKYSERKKKEARKKYEIQYENRAPSVYTPKPAYTPPTEQDFLNNISFDELEHEKQFIEPDYEQPDEDGYRETVVSRDEIEAWIDRNIYSITVDKENEGAKELLERLILEAADAYGDYEGYYNYLEANAAQLNQLAEKIIKYHNKKSSAYQEESASLSQFATILNLGRPLTPSQSERLENEGWVSFDYND